AGDPGALGLQEAVLVADGGEGVRELLTQVDDADGLHRVLAGAGDRVADGLAVDGQAGAGLLDVGLVAADGLAGERVERAGAGGALQPAAQLAVARGPTGLRRLERADPVAPGT